MILFPLLSSLLFIIAVILLFNLTPERITDDLLKMISPRQSLQTKIKIAQGKKKSRRITEELKRINDSLIATGKGVQFAVICTLSLIFLIFGVIFSVLINNIFLAPIAAITLALMPFFYVKKTISYYEKHISVEIETALSIISTSYIRSDDIVYAVKENNTYLKPPVNNIFRSFPGDATAISSDLNQALRKLKDKIDNPIFKEWIDTLIQCQQDRTLKDTLLPIVTKLTDVRIVNNELKTMLYEPRKEYFMMVALVIGNVPLLYMLNRDWFGILMNSMPGKIVLALSGVVVLITALMMMKNTKAVEYRW